MLTDPGLSPTHDQISKTVSGALTFAYALSYLDDALTSFTALRSLLRYDGGRVKGESMMTGSFLGATMTLSIACRSSQAWKHRVEWLKVREASNNCYILFIEMVY